MLKKMLALYKGTNKIAPVAEGIKTYSKGMLDSNCVDGDCSNCD